MIQENCNYNSVCLIFFVLFSKDALQFSGAMKNLNKQQQLPLETRTVFLLNWCAEVPFSKMDLTLTVVIGKL